MRHNGYDLTPYKSSMELEDGSTFTIKWVDATMPATFDDPSESLDDEYRYYIDGEEIDEVDIPEEVDDATLERLKGSAVFDSDWTFGPD